MNQIEQVVRRIDRFQQRHTVPAVIWAVVQKFGNDQAGALAARFALRRRCDPLRSSPP